MSNEPSENWDDDFVFQVHEAPREDHPPIHEYPTYSTHARPSRQDSTSNRLTPHDYLDDTTTNSRFSFSSAAWDDPEPGPSNPRSVTHEHDPRPAPNLSMWSEEPSITSAPPNDMDDFGPSTNGQTPDDLDRTVTSRRRGNQVKSVATQLPPSGSVRTSDKSWVEEADDGMYDRDFEDEPPPPVPAIAIPTEVRSPSVASTSSSHHLNGYRRAGQHSSSSLQLPASPIFRNRANSPGPRINAASPTMSTFSTLPHSSPVPSHLALRTSTSHGSARPLISPPPSSPPRPRRRLRKKSRPQDIDSNVFELMPRTQNMNFSEYGYLDEREAEFMLFDEMDEDRALQVITPPPVPYERTTLADHVVPPIAATPTTTTFPVSSPPSSPPTKTPLLSRIGSVKRWRSRRSSTNSKDLSVDTSMESTASGSGTPYVPPKTPEPSFSRAVTPSSPPSSSRNWLFRGSPSNPKTSPDLRRANSKGDRPGSRFGRRRSTTVEEVLEEEEDADASGKSKGKGKAKEIVTRVLHVGSHDREGESTPRQASAATSSSLDRKSSGRRPLSLQPQGKPTSAPATVNWTPASVGRSAPNPFVAARQKENGGTLIGNGDGPALDITKKRLPSSASVKRSSHKRSISLTSDPDEVSFTRGAVVSIPEAPPPVPPLPPGVLPSSSVTSLLPPIALSPPSPPRAIDKSPTSRWNVNEPGSDRGNRKVSPVSAALLALTRSGSNAMNGFTLGGKGSSPPSPGQSMSLGRATQQHASQLLFDVAAASAGSASDPAVAAGLLTSSFNSGHLRRSSLGDLKIPARISMAQSGLRNNLGMVREFASKVDELQKLQVVHIGLLNDLGQVDGLMHLSPIQLPKSPAMAAAVDKVEKHYALWWECAELLVELGGGTASQSEKENYSSPDLAPRATNSTSPVPGGEDDDPTVTLNTPQHGKRERAITLAGDAQAPTVAPALAAKSPPQATPSQWRASTGRHDLSSRQLHLLKEMLETPDPAAFDRVHASSGLRFASQPIGGFATASAITLPSIPSSPKPEETSSSLASESSAVRVEGKNRLQRVGRAGLTSIRDMLRVLTNRPAVTSPSRRPLPPSASSLSSTSEADVRAGNGRKQTRKRSSTDPKRMIHSSMKQANSPYNTALNERKSPRRPSLASIFRIGQSHSNGVVPTNGKRRGGKDANGQRGRVDASKRPGTNSTTTEEEEDYSDWDRMDDASDMEGGPKDGTPGRNQATLKGRRRNAYRSASRADERAHTPLPTSSQASLQSPRSAIDHGEPEPEPAMLRSYPEFAARNPFESRLMPPVNQSSTVRSAPNVPVSNFKLALTPENIRPLLEYAREVSVRVGECCGELREIRQLGVVEIVS